MLKRLAVNPFVLLTLAAVGFGAEQPLRVTAVRFWPQTGSIRIAIETNGEFRFHTERLAGPDRVFFDLFGARPGIRGKGIRSFPVNHQLLKRIRVAETLPGVTRVVLDLSGDASVSANQLTNPDRLIVTVQPSGLHSAEAAAPLRAPDAVVVPRVAKRLVLPQPSVRPDAAMPAPPLLNGSMPALAAVGQTMIAAIPAPAAPAPPPKPVVAAVRPKPVQQPPVLASAAPAAIHTSPAKPARSDSAGGRSLIRALGLKINRVVLDPGHGGHDEGTVSPGGLVEKDLVLDITRRLGALIEKRMGAEVIYTRTDDTFVPLEARTALANQFRADLFLSVHANSSRYRNVAGIETFYLNFTSAQDALEVAARENATSEKSVHELRDIIQKITMHDKIEESREFAARIQASLAAFAARSNAAARNRGVKKAPFVVLVGAQMPSVLVEVGFVTNPREESLLKRESHRQKLAEALYRGLARYSEGLSHFQVAQTDEGVTQASPPTSTP